MDLVASLFLWWTFLAPPLAVEPARQVVLDMAAGRLAQVRARMAPTFAAAVDDAMLRSGWTQVTAQAGALVSIDEITHVPKGTDDRVAVRCRFERAKVTLLLPFDGQGRLIGLRVTGLEPLTAWQPPAYAAVVGQFHEQPVTVGSHALPGLLTLPTGEGPFPAVVLVHGSGPQDEDETVGGIKPFKDLALGLAAHGIASLRYEKRTHFAPQLPVRTVDDETVDDARAALALAARSPHVDPARLFVAGHSLGGMMAPRIARGPTPVAGLVILAGGGRPFAVILREQLAKSPAVRAQLDQVERTLPTLPDDAPVELLTTLPAAYWRDLFAWRPAAAAAQLTMPLLVLQGDRDIQVRVADFDVWRAALAGHPRAICKHYPTLTHLFTVGRGDLSDYAATDAHVDAAVVADVSAFVNTSLH